MSTSTLIRRHGKSFKAAKKSAVASARIDPARIEQVEEQLLAAAIDHHPRRDGALDQLADDVSSLSAEVERSRRSPLLLRSTASLNRMEDLLLEAVVRTHPNRERAMDRLLDDVAGDDLSEPVPPALIDPTFVDQDFDGMS